MVWSKMTKYNLGNSIDNIHVTENVLTEEEHKKLLEYAINSKDWETQPWGVKFIVGANLSSEVVEILGKIFTMAYEKSKVLYSVDLRMFENTQIPLIKFDEGYKMNEHADTAGDIAAIYYLNDDYQGGEINFMDHNIKIKPKANSFITFPSNADYWHEVLENTGKERYSSTLWFHFVDSELVRPKLGLTR